MRPELPRDRISDRLSQGELDFVEGLAAAGAVGAARDLYELLAVVIGVCEALAGGLSESPQHAELARVGLLAADRAAAMVADLRTKAAAEAHAALPPITAPTAPMRKVLLVEDDPDLLSLLTAAFAREGFETHCAQNGRAGVQMLKALRPDLMVTDIVMPEMEGIAAIVEARRASPDTRVIAISGGGHFGKSQNFLTWARQLGADEALAKPFRMSSLITAARLLLDRPLAPIPANETTPTAEPPRDAVQL